MLELIALIGILCVGAALLAVFALVGLLFKVAFKILLLPFLLLSGFFKLVLFLIFFAGAILLAVVLAPALLAVLVALALPILFLVGAVSVGWALAT